MLLIWERSPEGGRKTKREEERGHVPRVSLRPLALLFVRSSCAWNPRREEQHFLFLSLAVEESRHPSSSADSTTGGVCLECSPRSFLLLLLLLLLLHLLPLLLLLFPLKLLLLIPSPPLLFSLPRAALKYSRFALLHSCGNSQPNPLRLCLVERERERESVHIHTWPHADTRKHGHAVTDVGPCRVQLVLSVRPRFSLSLAPLASTINILVRDSCTATPSADHVTDICKVSIIRGTAPTNRRPRAFSSLDRHFCFVPTPVKTFPACRSRLLAVH